MVCVIARIVGYTGQAQRIVCEPSDAEDESRNRRPRFVTPELQAQMSTGASPMLAQKLNKLICRHR